MDGATIGNFLGMQILYRFHYSKGQVWGGYGIGNTEFIVDEHSMPDGSMARFVLASGCSMGCSQAL